MGEPVILDAPAAPDEAEAPEPTAEEQEGAQEVPSVFSVTQRHLVGGADVSDPAEDGSRVLRLFSGNGTVVIEANLSPQLCDYVSGKLTEVKVEVIEEVDAEVVEDNAGSKE